MWRARILFDGLALLNCDSSLKPTYPQNIQFMSIFEGTLSWAFGVIGNFNFRVLYKGKQRAEVRESSSAGSSRGSSKEQLHGSLRERPQQQDEDQTEHSYSRYVQVNFGTSPSSRRGRTDGATDGGRRPAAMGKRSAKTRSIATPRTRRRRLAALSTVMVCHARI